MDLCPSLFCLSFYLLYFVLTPFEEMDYLSGCLMSSGSIQKLFCGIYSAFKCSFDEFVGEKVVSLSYSSAILGPPTGRFFTNWAITEILKIHTFSSASVQFSHSVVSDSLRPHALQHTRLPCPSPTPGGCSNSCASNQWCHPTISSSVIPFSSCLQSFPASGSFPMNQFFTSGGQSIGVSVSVPVIPMNIQDWFPLGWTSWISFQSKGLSRVFSNTTVQKHQFFSAQLSLWSNSHIHTWPLEKP